MQQNSICTEKPSTNNMHKSTLPLGETGNFSPIFLDYLQGKVELDAFYQFKPVLSDFDQAIAQRTFSDEKRQTLEQVWQQQYAGLDTSGKTGVNIERITEKHVYTVTTGHQLNLFGGPLYFIYKLITVIRLAEQLNEKHPDKHFIPVYWMATEDHDFAEINHFRLFGKKVSWEREAEGAVGRMSLDGMQQVFDDLPEAITLMEAAYLQSSNLAEATRKMVHSLFSNYGLLTLDSDEPALKTHFKEIIKADVVKNEANELVEAQSGKLESLGYKTQIYPRAINFFYLTDKKRQRLVKDGDRYSTFEQDKSWSESEIITNITAHPEQFSPNVVMRPVYQECILPNLAYIGGPAEVAYWLQLKPVFDHFNVFFPMLLPRNFALVVAKTHQRKLEKLGLAAIALFQDFHLIKAEYIAKHSEQEFTLEDEQKDLQTFFDAIKTKAALVDKSLTGFIGAEEKKAIKSLQNIEKRLKKAEEQKQDVALRQIEGLQEKLFPGGSLQERTDNFLNFYINDHSFIQKLYEGMDPLNFQFYIFQENE